MAYCNVCGHAPHGLATCKASNGIKECECSSTGIALLDEDEIEAIQDRYDGELAQAKAEIEQLHVQMGGISVAALGCHKPDQIAVQGQYGWSVAYQDVLRLRRQFDETIAEIERLKADHAAAIEQAEREVLEMACEFLCETCLFDAHYSGVITDSPGSWAHVVSGSNGKVTAQCDASSLRDAYAERISKRKGETKNESQI